MLESGTEAPGSVCPGHQANEAQAGQGRQGSVMTTRPNRSEALAARSMLDGKLTNADYARGRAMKLRETRYKESMRSLRIAGWLAAAAIGAVIGVQVFYGAAA